MVFFLPLAATSFFITMTHSLFNAGLARLPSPEIYLSAFAVAKSLMQLLQSPVNMVRQTVTALVHDAESYHRVRRFMIGLVALVLTVFLIISFSGMAHWILENIMGVKGRVLTESIRILRLLALFPLAITLRGFMQGISIRFGLNYLVPIGTTARIIFVFAVVLSIDMLNFLPAYLLAGLMFLGAVLVEGSVVFAGAKLAIGNISTAFARRRVEMKKTQKKELTNRLILTFFWPLVLTSLLRTMSKPIINMGLARTIRPEIAISTYAVAWGLGMMIMSPLMMFHQLPLHFAAEEEETKIHSVRKFALILGVSLSTLIGIIAFSGLGYQILYHLIGASAEISQLAVDVLKVMIFLPLTMVAREFYWGLLMVRHRTKYISRGKIMNLSALSIGILIGTLINPLNPAIIGIIGMISGQTAESLYLYLVFRKFKRRQRT